MSFVVPPPHGEPLLTPKEVADCAGCHVSTIYGFIHDGKIPAVTIADRLLIAESAVEKFLREWPSRNRGVSARWRDYRAWKVSRDAAARKRGAR